MEMFKMYLQEINSNRKLMYDDRYFLSYAICGDELIIEDLFVLPEHRGKGILDDLLLKVEQDGRENRCSFIVSTCNSDRTAAIIYQIRKGFKLYKIENNVIYFYKEL